MEKDQDKAAYWLTKAAERGYAKAQTYLGVRYAGGEGVEKDQDKAVYWFTKAAKKGNADAQLNLGRC